MSTISKSREAAASREGAKHRLVTRSPSHRVEDYLEAEFSRPFVKGGTRLPTIRDLASHLNVSATTVNAVFRKLAKEGNIRTRGKAGSFLVAAPRKNADHLRIAVGAPLGEDAASDAWISPIGLGVFRAALQADAPVTLLGLPARLTPAAAREKLLANRPHVDGLILFPSALPSLDLRAEEVCVIYERERKPVVFLNPPSQSATENFVSADFFGASCLLGKAWRETGRRRCLLLLYPPLTHSVSAQLRYAGLVNGMGSELNEAISLRVRNLDDVTSECGYRAMQRVLAEPGDLPDAVYCSGDFLALGVLQALRERGRRVPEEVSVVGGSGVDLSDSCCPQLTRLRQPLQELGEQLVKMLRQRIELNGASIPGRVFPTPFTGSATTRPQENSLLQINQRNTGS